MKGDFPIINPPSLKSCPFCGGEAYLIGNFIPIGKYDEINEYEIGCERCEVRKQEDWDYKELVEWWNSRKN
jgi:Lar family restriction alleviation protein